MAAATSATQVQNILDKLRDSPVDSDNLANDVLAQVYNYLMGVSKDREDIHWFCGRATTTTVAAATFLIRLFAYTSSLVLTWKERLSACVMKCADCACGLERAKYSSRTTYLAAFSEEIRAAFFSKFEQWELESVLESLSAVGLTAEPTASPQSLSSVPVGVVYRIVSNLAIFQDERILAIINDRTPEEPLNGWPSDPYPPGMFILLMHRDLRVRHWAKAQFARCSQIPLSNESFGEPYHHVLNILAHIFSDNLDSGPGMSSKAPPALLAALSSDNSTLWEAFSCILRLIPPDELLYVTSQNIDMRRLVVRHLSDPGPEFAPILRCFTLVMKRLGVRLWLGEGPEYPQVIFDSVKDNDIAMTQLLEGCKEKNMWFLSWFVEYLFLIHDTAIYAQLVAKMANYVCEELQVERFGDARPFVMSLAAKLLKSQKKEDHRPAIANVLGIHAETLVSVAFSGSYAGVEWKAARADTQDLITTVMSQDLSRIFTAVSSLAQASADAKKAPTSFASLDLRHPIWKRTFAALQINDGEGIAVVLPVIAQVAHLDRMHSAAFRKAMSISGGAELLSEVNEFLAAVKTDFLASISNYSDRNTSSSAVEVLQRPGIVKSVVKLMLSPAEDLQLAGQTVVGLAFDTDVRMDCFRALLGNHPDGTLEGIFEFLSIFREYSYTVPEACSLSKSLVRCLTDIMEVLCAAPNGLLNNVRFLRSSDSKGPAAHLPRLWTSMNQTLALIFKRTPAWARYYDNEEMIVWMRDALIFGREMLAERGAFESAASTVTTVTQLQSKSIPKKMLNEMQQILTELTRWLRLTDEELLHQSFTLIESLFTCFKENKVTPQKDVVDRLKRYLKEAREKNTADSPRTRLPLSKLNKLQSILGSVEDEGEKDVEIVSVVTKPRLVPITISDDDEEDVEIVEKWELKDKGTSSKHVRRDGKPLTKAALPTHSTFTKPSKSHKPSKPSYFSEKDQKLLDQTIAIPKFRRSSTSTAGSSRSHPTRPSDGSRNGGSSRASTVSRNNSESGESESDEEESQAAILRSMADKKKALNKLPRIRKVVPERRQIKTIDVTTGKNAMEERIKQQREADAQRRLSARMNPDVSGLHRALLSWDYSHQGPVPPGEDLRPMRVPDNFTDPTHYGRVFGPLLLHELWAQIEDTKQNPLEFYSCTISARSHSDTWVDIEAAIQEGVRKDWYLMENEVVLLQSREGNKSVMAKASGSKQSNSGLACRLRVVADGNDHGLQINTVWKLAKLFSLSTIHREYSALVTLPYYDNVDTILRPRLSPPPSVDPKDIQRTMQLYQVNEPQAAAIESALKTEGFVLIQGPPGTGKTSTICGLIAASISRRPRPIPHPGRPPPPVPKILLCAPSNAAIDEIVYRLKEGYRGSQKTSSPIKVVRTGAMLSISPMVKDVSLNALVDEKLGGTVQPLKDMENQLAALQTELANIKEQRVLKQTELNSVSDNVARKHSLEGEIRELNNRRTAISHRLDSTRDQRRSDSRLMDTNRRRATDEVMAEVDVICTTLSGAGHRDMAQQITFDMVIIDEAAQAIELSSLIPLKYRCTRCVMVGDPQQLPPTVLSTEATKYMYNQSLFVRLQRSRPEAVHLLSIQYRMHPEISRLPSRLFYDGRLLDGPSMDKKTSQPWHTSTKFGVYKFFNVVNSREEGAKGKSFKNTSEARVVRALYSRLLKQFKDKEDIRVGIITPYRGQVFELRRLFEEEFGRDISNKVAFNTVDGFQGQEKDVIVLSCVRAGPGVTSVGFLADVRRMNVALTRAKSSVFIVGHAPTLERSNKFWTQIIVDARERSCLVDADIKYFTTPDTEQKQSIVVQKKSSKALAASAPAIPLDLATPLQLKAAVERTLVSTIASQGVGNEIEAPKGVKRNLPSTEMPPPAPNQPQPQHQPRPPPHDEGPPGPPFHKKKKKETSIFIPKKRRGDDNHGQGPSSNRPRLN
ncbi:SEN1 N terminal-domain-containing protein [Armillaria novae-zelandiae]|uniref:SEN1 N terminal-domain-containing protein n=1 Tax=Armillaria novae-zelandiae TaxID=153914 RepID=A0AA39PNU6_9AGAR|nr:SEN1 N terminal-domain-containing protein [Armillaria novae-zelandiae]